MISINPETIMKLRRACSHGENLATELFRTDFQVHHNFLSKNGNAFHSTKSQDMLINKQMNGQMSSPLNSLSAVMNSS